jgi:hypothetical protein
MSTWTTNKLGYRGENKGPRSILYVQDCFPPGNTAKLTKYLHLEIK